MTKEILHNQQLINNETRNTLVSEQLMTVLQSAMIALQNGTSADAVIKLIKVGIDDAMNPYAALKKELAELVKNEVPPNGEYYNWGKDSKWSAITFFEENYGLYHRAGILYKFQLRKMDPLFCDLFDKTKWAPQLPTKKEYINRQLSAISVTERKNNSRMHSALYRRDSNK